MLAMSKSKTGTSGDDKPTKKEQSLFEEDDEFEEFPTEGKGVNSRLAASALIA